MIDYYSIVRSLNYYMSHGYRHIEVPWIVAEEIVKLTCPPGRTIYPLANDGFLVASAEQGFLQLIKDKKLMPGKYIAVSPCFRDDPIDALHQRYFLKSELIIVPPSNGQIKDLSGYLTDLNEMVRLASILFREGIFQLEIINTSEITGHPSFDIQTKKDRIEVGSYGVRHHPDIGFWIYGTAMAEPRYSYAMSKK